MTQITPANVNRLGLAWSYEIGEGGGKQEGTPLFAKRRHLRTNQLEHRVCRRCKTGEELWRYDPKATALWQLRERPASAAVY
jgi:glucose dehydrogenase